VQKLELVSAKSGKLNMFEDEQTQNPLPEEPDI